MNGFSSFPFIGLVELVVAEPTDVLWVLPFDFGEEGAALLWLAVTERADVLDKVLPLDVDVADPRPRLEVGRGFFAANDIFCVNQTESQKGQREGLRRERLRGRYLRQFL